MAYTLMGHQPGAVMARKYVVDTYNDIASINTSQLLPGSTAFVITTSKTYMLKHDYTWAEVKISGGGGGSGGDDIIYDGGNEDDPTGDEIIYNGGDEDG